MSTESNQNLRVPQSKTGAAGITSQSVKSIMEAYKTQSKIQLYGDESAQSQGAGNENIGVTGRNIPLSMLRPSANPTTEIMVDESGNRRIVQRPSNGNIGNEIAAYGNIAKAYRNMKGITEEDDGNETEYFENGYLSQRMPRGKDLSSVKRFEAEYIEDMPDSDEGLLEVLELAINNAKANLEMLESLYAALSGSESSSKEYIEDDGEDEEGGEEYK